MKYLVVRTGLGNRTLTAWTKLVDFPDGLVVAVHHLPDGRFFLEI